MDETKPLQEKDHRIRLDMLLKYMVEKAYDGLTMKELWDEGIIHVYDTLHVEPTPSYRHQLLDQLKLDHYIKYDE